MGDYLRGIRASGAQAVVKVNASIAQIPSNTMAIIELWSLLLALVFHPGGEEPSLLHAAHVSCPSESAPGQVEFEGL